MGNVTISDVARIAGVSKATVSRVLNHPEQVDERTRKAVQKVIREKNYQPSATARNLVRKKSDTIAVVFPQMDNIFFLKLLRGIVEVADQNGLTLMCFSSNERKEKDLEILESLPAYQVLGLLYIPAVLYSGKEERRLLERCLNELGAPVVFMDRDIGLTRDGVFFDDYTAMYRATRALIEAGHTRIAILNGALFQMPMVQRQEGFQDALMEAGIQIPEEYVMTGDYSYQQAYIVTKEMMKLAVQPTAVITCNNDTTEGFLKAVYEGGKRIPDDYVNVALDKLELLNTLGIPYNYIERDARQMGRKAMEQLLFRLSFPDSAWRKIIIEPPFEAQRLGLPKAALSKQRMAEAGRK